MGFAGARTPVGYAPTVGADPERTVVVGVDENGLGPRLGPLVATAVAVEVAGAYDRARWRRAGKRLAIEDSKASTAFGQMAFGESIALALVERVHGAVPDSHDALLAAVSLETPLALRAPCPSAAARQCWGEDLPLPAFGGDPEEGRRRLAKLAKRGFRPLRARSAVTCAGVLNARMDSGLTKVVHNLETFERLLEDARRGAGVDLRAVCGMVGGIRSYRRYVRRFDPEAMEVLEESRRAARYRVPRVGDVAFEVDADDRHLPVALASMLGKYVRELGMERQNRFYRRAHPDLPRASGYHDPVTRRFVDATAALRRRLRIAPDCFERRR